MDLEFKTTSNPARIQARSLADASSSAKFSL